MKVLGYIDDLMNWFFALFGKFHWFAKLIVVTIICYIIIWLWSKFRTGNPPL